MNKEVVDRLQSGDEKGAMKLVEEIQSMTCAVTVVGLTPEEIEQHSLDTESARIRSIDEARARRNALLAQSDWTQLTDVVLPHEKLQAWYEYRRMLRDLVFDDPSNIKWPTPPS
jgi:hypothetical protein